MSEASERGKRCEVEVAKMISKKLGVLARRDARSGAGSHAKSDIVDWFRATPFDFEVKDQATIKVKEWYRQAVETASFTKKPVVAFRCDDQILAVISLNDLLDIAAELAQSHAERLSMQSEGVEVIKVEQLTDVPRPVSEQIDRGSRTCRNGHLVDSYGKCMAKVCPYSRYYKAKKEKKQ